MNSERRTIINQKQQEFYDKKNKNFPTRIWSFFRNGLLNRIKKDVGVEQDIYKLHKKWFGKLGDKKVLDLGCYMGNSLSLYLAEHSQTYVAIDLSERGIKHLRHRLKDIPGARAEVVDFLSEDFEEKDFDLIYAYGVLHHFRDVDELITQLLEKLGPHGRIISHDPLQTSIPLKLIRMIYRPFQSDKDWEWPFTRKTYYKFSKAFRIIERRAVLGKTKWMFLVNLLPLSEKKKVDLAKRWHQEDWEKSGKDVGKIFHCMHLSLLMQKK